MSVAYILLQNRREGLGGVGRADFWQLVQHEELEAHDHQGKSAGI